MTSNHIHDTSYTYVFGSNLISQGKHKSYGHIHDLLYKTFHPFYKPCKLQIYGHLKLSNEQTAISGILSHHSIQRHAYIIPTGNCIISLMMASLKGIFEVDTDI